MSSVRKELSPADIKKLFENRTYIERVVKADSEAKKWFEWLRDFAMARIGVGCVVTEGTGLWSFLIHPRDHRVLGGFYILDVQIDAKNKQPSPRSSVIGSLDSKKILEMP